MAGLILATGLLGGGALGFGLGAHPVLMSRLYRKLRGPRRSHGHSRHGISNGHDHEPGHNHAHGHDHAHEPDSEHAGHGHPSYQAREDQEAQDLIDYLYPLAVAFFAGFVLSTLVPDALTHSKGSFACFAAGIAVMGFLSKKVFKRDPCCEGGHDNRGFGAVSLLAMSVCSLNDGLLLGLLSPAWFSGLNLGMVIHKVTSSFAIAQVLKQTRFRGLSLYAFGAFSVGISPIAFTAARSDVIRGFPQSELVLAFSAGLLAWVAVGSLLPHALGIIRRRPRAAIGFVLALGVAISLGFVHTSLHRRMEAAGPETPAGPPP